MVCVKGKVRRVEKYFIWDGKLYPKLNTVSANNCLGSDLYSTLVTKLIDLPILLPDFKKIITNPAGETHPLIEQTLTILMEDQLGSIQLFVVCYRGCLMNAPQHPDTIRYGMCL